MRIAVAGGTGLIGRMVVEEIQARGHEPVVISRSRGVDLVAGTGLAEALKGVDAVIDVSNKNTMNREQATAFFTTVTRNLLRATGAHVVGLSIVGVDRVKVGYYQGKLAAEQLLLAEPGRATVLRATQFHEFAEQSLGRAFGPFLPVPKMRSQPVAAREVAAELVRVAEGPARGMAPEMAGPQVLAMPDMVREVARVRGVRKLLIPLPLPGPASAMAKDGLLPLSDGPRGVRTFDEWLKG